MRLLKFKIAQKTVFVSLSLVAFVVLDNGCSFKTDKQRSASTTKEKATCGEKNPWTDTIIGSWYLRLHGPGPVDQRRVWEGPVEIGRKPNVFFCKIDIELVDSIWVGSQNSILFFSGYSGSNTYHYIVNVDSCSTATKKMSFTGGE